MGRPRDEIIWKHYNEHANKAVNCKYCQKQYRISNVNKMEAHLLKCTECPAKIKKEIKERTHERNTRTLPLTPLRERNQISSNSVAISPNASTSSSGSNMKENVQQVSPDKMSNETKNVLTSKLVKAIVVSGAPLSMVEHPLWIELFNEMNPSFKMPSRKAVSTTHLDKLYQEIKKEVVEDLNSVSYLHMQLDGWSNRRNEGIINFLISKPEPYFVESLNTEENRHTGEYISEEIEKVMHTHGEAKFVVMVGDNAKNIQKAFRIVKNTHPQIVPINCAAHTLHLLCDEAMKSNVITHFIDLVKDVIKTIKKSQALSSLLSKIVKEKKSGETLKLPSKTRWGSHLNALKSLKNTKAALQTLAVHEGIQMQAETKSTLLDDDFWTMIDQSISILEPITTPIFELESNKCNISNVVIVLKDMKSKIDFILPDITIIGQEDKARILTDVHKRSSEILKPIHYAAYLLDPKSLGVELNEGQESEAMEFIFDMAQFLQIDVMSDLADYKAKEGFWGKRFVWCQVDEINPVVWWKGICKSTKLSKVAVRILSAPTTSAAVERSFSTYGNIHTNKRNRLTTDRAAKIAFTSYNWNLLHKYNNTEDLTDDDTPTPNAVTPVIQSESNTDDEANNEIARPEFVFMDCDDEVPNSDDDDE